MREIIKAITVKNEFKGLLLRLYEYELVQCAEAKFIVIQDVKRINFLFYNNKLLRFNLNMFRTDLKSSINHYDIYKSCYLIHDLLYSELNNVFSRFEADVILFHLLNKQGKSKLVNALEFLAIRLFGRRHFDNYKNM